MANNSNLKKKELKHLKKDELICIILELQEERKCLSEIKDRLDEVNFKITGLHSELSISKQVNTILKNSIVELEKKSPKTKSTCIVSVLKLQAV